MRAASLRALTLALLSAGVLSLLVVSGVAAQGKGGTEGPSDIEGLSLQKSIQKYPQLDSTLGGLVADHEGGKVAAQAAASQVPVHIGARVAVTIYISGDISAIRSFLESNGGDPRNVGEDYIEAYVPVSLLGQLSEQTGVLHVRTIIPPVPSQSPLPSCTEDLGALSQSVTLSRDWLNHCSSDHHANRPAQYYRFTLDQPSFVTIDHTSPDGDGDGQPDADTYLFLVDSIRRGWIIRENNDRDATTTNSRIQVGLSTDPPRRARLPFIGGDPMLPPKGTYIVEAAHYDYDIPQGARGFELAITLSPVPGLMAEHGVPAWHDGGYKGQGLKVGILDESFLLGLAEELPDSRVFRCYVSIGHLPIPSDSFDCIGDGHGGVVAEAVADIAPNVELYLSDPPSRGDLKDTVEWMIEQGVDVILNTLDWTWDGPGDGSSPFSDSPLRTVDAAVEAGIIWIDAAGNAAGRTWFGPYVDSDSDGVIEFGRNDRGEPVEINTFPLRFPHSDQIFRAQLRWDDRWGGASSDLDLFVFRDINDDGVLQLREIVASSVDHQSGAYNHYPHEGVTIYRSKDDEYHLVVAHFGGDAPSWVQVQLFDGDSGDLALASLQGSIGNPAESVNQGLLAVGAAPWWSTSTIESFSSRGPTPDGRIKPGLVGADRGDSSLRGPSGFSGTSQAAGYVAGLATLVLQAFPKRHTGPGHPVLARPRATAGYAGP